MATTVWIDGPSGSNLELAKNLVLSAVNVALGSSMTDPKKYAFSPFVGDPSRLVSEMQEMNPIVRVRAGEEEGEVWAVGAESLAQVLEAERKAKERGVPLFVSMCCGFDGWVYYGGSLNEEGFESAVAKWGKSGELTPVMYAIISRRA